MAAVVLLAAGVAVVMAALMALAVVMVAVGVAAVAERARQQGLHRRVRAALHACVELYARLGQGHARAAAQAAADEGVHAVGAQEAGQGPVAKAARGQDGAVDDLAVLDVVELELLGVAKVLEHAAVFVSDCYFHVCYLHGYWLMPII